MTDENKVTDEVVTPEVEAATLEEEKVETKTPNPTLIATIAGTKHGMAIELSPKGTINSDVVNSMIAGIDTCKVGDRTTVALLKLRNGFMIPAAVSAGSAEGYDEKLGFEAAKSECLEKLYKYMGFLIATAQVTPPEAKAEVVEGITPPSDELDTANPIADN